MYWGHVEENHIQLQRRRMMIVRKTLITGLIAGGMVLCAGPSANAAVVFADDFEDTSVVPGLPDAPQTGAYPTSTTTDPESLVVAAGGSHPLSPGAGSNILNTTGKDRNYGEFSSAAAGTGTVTYEFDARLDASTDNNFGVYGNPTSTISLDGNDLGIWLRLGAGGILYSYSGGWVNLTSAGVSHTEGAWQHYVIEYELGASTYDLTVGATTVTGVAMLGVMTEVNGVLFGQGGSSTTGGYTDNVEASFVPEPGSLAIAGLGALCLIVRKRR